MTKCYICEKGSLEKKRIDYFFIGENLGKVKAEVCGKCNETFFDEKTSLELEKKAKEKGLWGLESVTKVGKVGDSIDVKITKKIADFCKLSKGREVRVFPESRKKLIISF